MVSKIVMNKMLKVRFERALINPGLQSGVGDMIVNRDFSPECFEIV